MNKSELVDAVAKDTNLSKSDVTKAIDSFVNVVKKTLKAEDDVRLVGFGTFCVYHRKASEGRNPRTGEKIKIAAARVPKFKPGKDFKECLA